MKRLPITLFLASVLVLAASAQQPATPPRVAPSPHGSAATQVAGKWVSEKPGTEARYRDGKWITVDYSRPILKGRSDVFGAGVEYGKKVNAGAPVWRAGANASTRFKTEVPLVLAGKAVPAGEYSIFIELKETSWTFILSAQAALLTYDPKDKVGTWGADNYDPKFDLVRAPMKHTKQNLSFDELTYAFVDMTQQGGTLALCWGQDLATVAFKVAP